MPRNSSADCPMQSSSLRSSLVYVVASLTAFRLVASWCKISSWQVLSIVVTPPCRAGQGPNCGLGLNCGSA